MDTVRYQPRDLFEEFFSDIFSSSKSLKDAGSLVKPSRSGWTPAVSITENSESYLVSADVPGVDPEEIDVTFESGVLTIKGERASHVNTEENSVKREERYYGSFVRQFAIPEGVDDEKISAKSTNGVLQVVLPKQAKAEPKKISVN